MKQKTKNQNLAIHEAAPDLLMDKIAELEGILAKFSDSKHKNHEQLAWYKRLLDVMRFSFHFMMETKYIHEKNAMLESQVKHLAYLNDCLKSQLDEYLIVQRLTAEDRLDNVLDVVNNYCDNYKSLKINSNNGSN